VLPVPGRRRLPAHVVGTDHEDDTLLPARPRVFRLVGIALGQSVQMLARSVLTPFDDLTAN
jgi:hypothetical protein